MDNNAISSRPARTRFMVYSKSLFLKEGESCIYGNDDASNGSGNSENKIDSGDNDSAISGFDTNTKAITTVTSNNH